MILCSYMNETFALSSSGVRSGEFMRSLRNGMFIIVAIAAAILLPQALFENNGYIPQKP